MNRLRRRLLLASAALAAPRAVRAQQSGRTYVVGIILRENLETRGQYREALSKRLATHGFIEGRNLRVEQRPPEGEGVGSGREAARALLALNVDAILSAQTGATEGALLATRSVPLVFTWVSDPLGSGIVQSLSRPGGNATGVSSRFGELSFKRFELALELVPGAKRVALVGADRFWPNYDKSLRPILEQAAKQRNLQLLQVRWSVGSSVEDAHRAGADVVLSPGHLLSWGYAYALDAWIKSSIERRLPVIFVGREEVEAGGLISYGTNIIEDLRRAADLLARVLKGENPGDLPVDQASRFELAVNLKTAKAMDLPIPPAILLRADQMIE